MRYHIIPVPAGGQAYTAGADCVLVGLARNWPDLATPGTAIPWFNVALDNQNIADTPWDAELIPETGIGDIRLPMPKVFIPAGSMISVYQTGAAVGGVNQVALPAGAQVDLVAREATRDEVQALRGKRWRMYVAFSGLLAAGAISSASIPVNKSFRLYYTISITRTSAGAHYTIINGGSGVACRVNISNRGTTSQDRYADIRSFGTRGSPLFWDMTVPVSTLNVDFQNTSTEARLASLVFIGVE